MRNWAGTITFATDEVREPRSVEQLQEIVARATRIRALGSRHSFNRIADTPGAFVTVDRLDLPIGIDEHAATVTVPAGARYGEVATALQARGLALGNLASLPHISVAGACATGTHGSGDANRGLAAAVRAIEFVRADGGLVRTARGDADFAGSVVALGALGIVTRLTLDVEASYPVRQDVWLDAPLPTVLARLDEVMAAGYSVSLFSDPGRPAVIDRVWIKSRGAEVADGTAWGARAAATPQHPIGGHDPAPATDQLGVVGPWHERLPHFRLEHTPSDGDEQQSEYLVDRAHAVDALAATQALDLGGALRVAEFRTVAADELWLSPAGGRDSFALHFTWVSDDAAVGPAVARVERALAPFGPRPHWGKVFGLDPATVRAAYPLRARFAGLAARHDPQRKFGNDFLARYVY